MHLLGVEASMGSMRGKVHEVRGRKLVATYHPAYLLRSPGQKKECWKDIQLAMGELGLSPPASGGADAGPGDAGSDTGPGSTGPDADRRDA
jgi:DNA polymerase